MKRNKTMVKIYSGVALLIIIKQLMLQKDGIVKKMITVIKE